MCCAFAPCEEFIDEHKAMQGPGGRRRRGHPRGRLIRFARDARLLGKPVDLEELEKAVTEACAA